MARVAGHIFNSKRSTNSLYRHSLIQNLENDGRGIRTGTRKNRSSTAKPGELDSDGEFQHGERR